MRHPKPIVLATLALIAVALAPQTIAQTPSREAPRSTPSKIPAKAPEIIRDPARLPLPVRQMREAIQEAIRRGDIGELKFAIELNELKPDFGLPPATDPIEGLRKLSGDGEGRTILAALANLLDAPCAVIHAGADIENNRLFVWPYLAELDPTRLKPAELVDLYRLHDHATAQAMIKEKKWTAWRLAIGADGVWHAFTRTK